MRDDMESFDAGHLRLSRRRREVWLGGVPVRLGGRAFDLLCVLIDQGDQLLNKHDLLDRVWPRLVVEENNLHTQVKALRQALGAGALATVPGRGYRFTLLRDDGAAAAPMPATGVAPAAVQPVAPQALLLGRQADAAALHERLLPGCCVTLAGPAGVGKTALAQWVAAQTQAPLVDLMAVQDGALLPALVGQRLGVSTAGPSPLRTLAQGLRDRAGGLVIDNAEHLVADVAALVQAVNAEAPGLWVLVTSQVPLHLGHELVLRLAPLPLPAADADLAGAAASPAVQLFVDTVQRLDRRFELGPSNVRDVVGLCRALDGLPLALRLAAARVPLVGLQAVRLQLQAQPGRVLAGGARDAAPRHASLQAALDWSVSLLAPTEQQVLARLGVLPGPFALDLAAAAAADEGLDEWAVIEALATLVDRSLLEVQDTEPMRYRLLDSVRSHSLAHLRASGDLATVCGRAAELLQQRFAAEGERDPVALARLCSDAGRPADALRLWLLAADRAAAASCLGELEHHLTQALTLLRQPPLDQAPDSRKQRVALMLRLGPVLGLTRGLASDITDGLFREVLELTDQATMPEERFIALFNRALTTTMRLRFDSTRALLQELDALARSVDDPRVYVQRDHAIYSTVLLYGRLEESLAAAESGYRRYRPADSAWHCTHFAGHDPGVCSAGHAALSAWLMGRFAKARQWADVLAGQLETCTHAPSRMLGASTEAWRRALEGDRRSVARVAGEWRQTCKHLAMPVWMHNFAMLEQWAQATDPETPDPAAVDRLGHAYLQALAMGTRFRMPCYHVLWVDALAHHGRVAEGRKQADACLQEIDAQWESMSRPWLFCIRAQLHAQAGQREHALADYRTAMRDARAMQSSAFTLRAALGLARWQQQCGEPAGDELRHVVAGFAATESAAELDAARAWLAA